MTNTRYRLTFGKGRALRFTSHLDLHRAWERTFRRAELSLAYSEGFSPRPKINIGAALPLGCTSQADLVDIELAQDVEAVKMLEALNTAAPPGLTIDEIATVQSGSPKLQKLIASSEYLIPVPGQDRKILQARIQAMLAAEKLPRKRRNKKYDLRPLIEEMRLADPQEGTPQTATESGTTARPMELRLQMTAMSGATGRPDEVLLALELDPTPLVPHRVRLFHK